MSIVYRILYVLLLYHIYHNCCFGQKPKTGVPMPYEPFYGTLNFALGKRLPGPLCLIGQLPIVPIAG